MRQIPRKFTISIPVKPYVKRFIELNYGYPVDFSSDNEALGGLLNIWAVPNSVISVNGKEVSFSNSADIYAIYCTAETMNLKEDPVSTNAGIHYKTDVTGFVPGNREDVLEAVNVMQSKPYQIIIQDGNGNYLLAGTQSYPLRLTAILQVGTKVSDPVGYQVHFTGQTILRAMFINNPF